MISKITLSRTEIIPFLEKDNQTVMQMKNFEIGVTVEGDSEEEAQAKLDTLFQDERDKLSKIIPLLKSKDKKIQCILGHLKTLASDSRYQSIIEEAKKL